MWKKGIGIFLGSIISFLSHSQIITISNQIGQGISGVFIYHDKRSYTAFTDENGQADISHFPKDGYFHFQHTSYQNMQLEARELATASFRVQMTEKLTWFNELVISANKWEQNEKELAQQIGTIDRKEVEFSNPATSADLLGMGGQVFVQKSQLGGGSPKLRGFSANAVLLVIDGVRMNNAIYRSGNLQNVINIDPNAIASSEVVFGPGSVIYGSDALGGVMDFHTVTPRWNQVGTKVEGNALTRFSSASDETTGHVDLSVSRRRFTYFGSVTQSNFDHLKAGSNRSSQYKGYFLRPTYARRMSGEDVLVTNSDPNVQVGSAFDLTNTIQKFKFLLNQHADLSYNFYYSTTSNIPRYDRLTIADYSSSDSLEYGDWFYGPQEWMMHSLQFGHYERRKLYDQIRITAAFQDYRESRNDRKFGADDLRIRTEEVDAYSINLDVDKSLKRGDLFYGLEWILNNVSSQGILRNLDTGEQSETSSRYPDGGSTYSSLAAYLSMVRSISDTWTFNLGARITSVTLDASRQADNLGLSNFSEINLHNNSINGFLGMVHLPNKQTKVAFNFSTGFRAPNVDDIGKIFDFDEDEDGQPIILVPNGDLKPEYACNSEISLAHKKGIFTINLVGFYTFLTQPILRADFTIDGESTVLIDDDDDPSTPDVTYGVVAQVNGDNAKIYGFSSQLKIELSKKLTWHSSLSYSDGLELSTNEPLRHTTPLFGRSGIRLTDDHRILELYTEFNGPRWRSQIPSTEIEDKPYLYTADGSPGWMTLNFKIQQQIGHHLSMNLGVENIFDTHYRPYTSGISAPGRNFIVSLRGKI